jgi:hypothetical protein
MIHAGRSAPREANKAQTANNPLGAVETCKMLLIVQAVLQRDQRCLLVEEGREQRFQ